MSLLGGTYGSREREISSNDAKRGDDCLQADFSVQSRPFSPNPPLLSLALKIGHGDTEERRAFSSWRIESSRAKIPEWDRCG
jgi:hypothetical protein